MTENIVLKLCGVQQIFTSSCLNIYIRVEEGFKITELSGHIKKLEKLLIIPPFRDNHYWDFSICIFLDLFLI